MTGVQTCALPIWDFADGDNSVYDSPADDHGTHVSGTITGTGGNGIGVAGVNWNATIISGKFLNPTGTTANAILAVDYFTDLKIRHGMNIVATNNSWGGGGYSQGLHSAIIRHAKRNILFVAAAGNAAANNDTTANYPSNYNTTVATTTETAASYDGVIAVASIDSAGALSGFSSYGATTVDIGAPGSGVLSTVPVSSYAYYDGTSMATPHVTGALALYSSVQSVAPTGAALKSAILNSAVPTTSLNGKVATNGRLNVYNAIRSSKFIYLDRTVYGSTSLVTITVSHATANSSSTTAETVTTQISSTTEGSPLSVTLTETGVNTGIFSGTVQLAPGTPITDALLQVVHADVITATYPALGLTDTAVVDALPPGITNILVTPTSGTADISWNTDEPASSFVRYGTNPLALTMSVSASGYRLNHSLLLTGLNPDTTYFYQIEIGRAHV